MNDNYNPIERTLRRFDKIMSKIETFLSVGTTSMCGLLLLFGVLNRVFFKIPLRWTEEACRMMLILMVFTSLPIVSRERSHLKLAVLSEMVKNKKVSRALNFVADFSLAIIFAIIFILFSKYTIQAFEYGVVSAAMGYPMWIMYGICTLTFLDTTIRSIMVCWDDYFSTKSLFPRGGDDFSIT